MERPAPPPANAPPASLDPDLAHALLATAGAVVILLDHGGRIVYLNPAGEQLTGYPLAEVRGQPF